MLELGHIEEALKTYKPSRLLGDHTLNPDFAPQPPFRNAAVLLPLLAREDGLSMLFTLRTAHLHAHAGQVSFPGGGAEPHDMDEVATALRESHEEIGLKPENVRVLGTLDHYITRSGYRVRPVVGLVQGAPEWTPDSFEVAEIFEVPLSHILCPGNLSAQEVTREGVSRRYYACNWQDYYIWGATAGMLRNFVEVVGGR